MEQLEHHAPRSIRASPAVWVLEQLDPIKTGRMHVYSTYSILPASVCQMTPPAVSDTLWPMLPAPDPSTLQAFLADPARPAETRVSRALAALVRTGVGYNRSVISHTRPKRAQPGGRGRARNASLSAFWRSYGACRFKRARRGSASPGRPLTDG